MAACCTGKPCRWVGLVTEDFEVVPPDPAALVESLRAFGYSVEASVADLVDNSITAGADSVEVDFVWSGEDSMVLLVDDGHGMDESTLRSAMRPGSSNPLAHRDGNDLGRFGLGLKTASFSHARSLTVASKVSGGQIHVRRWDLDHVGAVGAWQLLIGPSGDPDWLRRLEALDSGTVVVWEKLDRIIEGASDDDEKARIRFYELRSHVENHLGVVFHRFLTNSKRPFSIKSNDNTVLPWDPFLTDHESTQWRPLEELPLRDLRVTVQPYVLPHHSRLTDEQHKNAAGPDGWNASQGFYLYRADRMISWGGWLGGLKVEEHYKLARISIDISQNMDSAWDIDVRKARARPPGPLRDDLRRIATATRSRASEVYRHRGKLLSKMRPAGDPVPVWHRRKVGTSIRYTLNRKHAVLLEAMDGPKEQKQAVRRVLDLAQRTLPVAQIAVDAYEAPEGQADPDPGDVDGVIVDAARVMFKRFVDNGMDPQTAKTQLLNLEPFFNYPGVIEALFEEFA